MRDYQSKLQLAEENIEKYWEMKLKIFTWFKKYSKVLDDTNPFFPKWFPGGELSISYECLDTNVENGHGNEIALIFESFYTKRTIQITYKELLDKVSRLAGSFAGKGISKRDRVLIFLPGALETAVSMLAVARLGAVYTVAYASLSDEAIAERIDDFKPKIIVTANDDYVLGHSIPMKELMDKAIEIATHKPNCCFIWQRPDFKPSAIVSGRDFDLDEAIETGEPHDFVPVEVNQPIFVVYTSGTTGKPKGIVHGVRGVASALANEEGSLINPDIDSNLSLPVSFIPTNYSWLSGQLAGCYLPLFRKVPSILYEEAIKDVQPDNTYLMLKKHRVTTAFISTQGFRAMLKNDPDGKMAEDFKPFNLKIVFCGGSHSDMVTLNWARQTFSCPIVQLYGQTEFGGRVTTVDYDKGILKTPPLSVGKPIPGTNIKVMTEDESEARYGQTGKIMLKLPLPPSMMLTILNDDESYVNMFSSSKIYYNMMDEGKFDEEGNLYVLNRSDAVFKGYGNYRISCAGVEEVMMSHDAIAECVVVTKFVTKNGISYQIPEGFYVTKKDVKTADENIAEELVQLVHKRIGGFVPLSPPHKVAEFPKTVSGKISRSQIENILRNPNNITTSMMDDSTFKSICEVIQNIQD